jgi:predicted O-methyltransferase YrrM
VHSPFVFDFIRTVLNDKSVYDAYSKVEEQRKKLLHNHEWITIRDYGAGKSGGTEHRKRVNEIASRSLKSPKYAKLLFRIARRYFPETNARPLFLELGTSLGITTSYFALANPSARVVSFEGASGIAAIARQNFSDLGTEKIGLVEGNFDETLPPFLETSSFIDLAFIDGNHSEDATLRYFEMLLKKRKGNSIFIFDDVHWSQGMENAWQQILQHPAVTLSIDLFFIGIVFFNTDFKVKQDFRLRF